MAEAVEASGPLDRGPARVVQNHHLDSTLWAAVRPRAGDLVVCNWAKSGMTWTQQICLQLMTSGDEGVELLKVSGWPEWQTSQLEWVSEFTEGMADPRIFKSHLPADAMPIWPEVKYVYVGRDARDVVLSLHAHHRNISDAFYETVNGSTKPRPFDYPRPDPDIGAYVERWLDEDGYPYWPFWSHVQSWWDIRDASNVLLLHYQDLTDDLEREVRRIADFLGVEPDAATLHRVLANSSFGHMKSRAGALISSFAFRDNREFMNKGVNGRWRAALAPDQAARCASAAARELSPDCAAWLMRSEP
jgi:aryl sulfotransferase